MKTKIILLGIFGCVLSSLFVIQQTQHAVILLFGNPVRVISEPGLHMKIPMLEKVYFFEKRMLNIESSAIEVTLGDKRRVVVDAFCRYKIIDPLKFFQAVRTESEANACFLPIMRGSLVSILGKLQLTTLLSENRSDVMKEIREEVNKSAGNLGVRIVDVRIKKVDLPYQNSEAISKRMISERAREAKELRAKGFELAQVIKSTADKENSIALNEAHKKAKIIIAQGEEQANDIYIKSYQKNEEFFNFIHTLDSYEKALNEHDTIILDNSGFFELLN